MAIMIRTEEIVADFVKSAALAGILIPVTEIHVEEQPAPHDLPSLPRKMQAVYVFMLGDRCLKVGRAGPGTGARYRHQHYGVGRAPSTLAESLLKANFLTGGDALTEDTVGGWIRAATDRINFLIPERYDIRTLSFLEAFIQGRLRPEFEGRAQRGQPVG